MSIPAQSEAAFQRQVVQLARLLGFRVAHFCPVKVTRNGKPRHLTPVAADGAGFVDLVLVHRRTGKLIFAELKSESGRVRPNQAEWIEDLRAAGQEVYVWRPSQWSEVERTLRAGHTGRATT